MSLQTRRELLTWWIDAFKESPPPLPDRSLLPEFLRPPGAAPEDDLLALCERCGKCREACPHDVILPLGPAYGDAEGTPALLPRDGPCRLCDGLPCAAACPSGALKVVALSEVRMGTARLAADRCWAVMGQPCDYCVQACPLEEKALSWDGDRPVVSEEACVGCGLCVHFCTATPPALSIHGQQTER